MTTRALEGPLPADVGGNPRSIAWVIGLSMAATCFAKLPLIFTQIDSSAYYLNNAALLGTVPLAAYMAARRRVSTTTWAFGAAFVAVAIFVANRIPLLTVDANILARIHFPVAAWGLVGLPFAGGAPRSLEERVSFLSFTGEVAMLSALLIGGGVAVGVTTVVIFNTLGFNLVEWYLHNVAVWGLLTAPLVAAHLATGPLRLSLVGRVSTVFVPFLLATLLVYLVALGRAGWEPFTQRDFLANLNAVLVGSAFLTVAVVCDASRRAHWRLGDVLNLALIAVTCLVAATALFAIAARIWTEGAERVRLAVFGTDALVFALFAGMLRQQALFVSERASLAAVRGWIARCLPVLIAWAFLVALLLPVVAAR